MSAFMTLLAASKRPLTVTQRFFSASNSSLCRSNRVLTFSSATNSLSSMFCLFGVAGVWKLQSTKAAFFTRRSGLTATTGEVRV